MHHIINPLENMASLKGMPLSEMLAFQASVKNPKVFSKILKKTFISVL